MPKVQVKDIPNLKALEKFVNELSLKFKIGDIIFLDGPLGAGKTTFVRFLAKPLGYNDPVRSPTFNLIQILPTQPPIMHADLYRVNSYAGIGIEDYLDTHLCIIEWSDRAKGLIEPDQAWQINIEFADCGRKISIQPPKK